jgi:hypothetical protein
MSWISDKLLAAFDVLVGGIPLPRRRKINFAAGAKVVDNPAEGQIDVTIDTAVLGTATPLAKPGELCQRSASGSCNFGGVCQFANVVATGSIDCTLLLVEKVCQASGFALGSAVIETRVMNGAAFAAASDWRETIDGFWSNLTIGRSVRFDLDVPNGATLTSVSIFFHPAPGHVGLPAQMPVATVRAASSSTGLAASVATATDSSSTLSAYEAGHVLTVGGMAHTVDRSTERYHVTFTAEAGANALPLATTITVSATWQRPAGSKVGQD